MIQTSKTQNVYFPDGAKVSVKAPGDSVYTDLGAIEQGVSATFNWDEFQVETGNAGKLAKRIRNMTMAGSFNLINLEPVGVSKMGGGVLSVVTTDGSAVSAIPNQIIAAGWNDNIRYELEMLTSSSDSTKLKVTAKPTITTVTLDVAGTPEVLTEDNDYVVVADSNSYSGWSIQFISTNMSTGTPKTKAITIDFGTNIPVAKTTVYGGASGTTLDAYAMKVTHTDSNSKVKRVLNYLGVDPNSGGFQFNFKGANEDGVETMPLTFTAKIDASKTDGRQLFAWSVDSGAE